MMAGDRLPDLDRARGLAIILVVFGHLVARQDPAGVTWYEPLRACVYLFHMPFFFYLSGYVAFLSGSARTAPAAWPALAARRAERLLLPVALFGVSVIAAKLLLARWIAVDNVPTDIWSGVTALALDPDHSPAVSIWYLLVLFFYSLATPLLLAADGGRRRVLGLLAVLLFLLQAVPATLYLDRACQNAVFFVAGGFAADARWRWQRAIDRARAPLLGALLLALVAAGLSGQAFGHRWWLLLCGLLAIPALHGLARMPLLAGDRILLALGQASFVIYLLNTVCIGLAKGLMLRVVDWDGAHFAPFALVLMLAGLAGPLAIRAVVQMGWRRLPDPVPARSVR